MDTSPTLAARQLDNRGRCCGRKPIVYKREHKRFCDRCCRAYDIDSGKQIANWAWATDGDGFRPLYPDNEYAQKGSAP